MILFRQLAVIIAIIGTVSQVALAAPLASESALESPYVSASYNLGILDGNDNIAMIQDMFIPAVHSSEPTVTPIPVRTQYATVREMIVDSTGYNSEVGQTDDSPFITANGEHVYWGGAAANFLPFGTKIMFPDHFPGVIFEINDRMNKRYWERVDIWFAEKPAALQWGVRKVRIQILES